MRGTPVKGKQGPNVLDAQTLTSPHSPPTGGQSMLHLDTGNTAFMLLCASLVMLMTPGLAFFYGGLVGRKNVLAIMMQSFVSMGWTTVLWWAFGFSLCFSGDQKSGTDFFGIIGNLDWVGLRGITLSTPSPNDTIPMLVFCAYQMMFAIITPALITGAFTNRITFKAYMLFLTAWLILCLLPIRPHGVGRRHPGAVGREGFCRRDRRAQHRGNRRARLDSLRRKAQSRRTAARTAFRSSRSARACSGLVGTASMPDPSSASIRLPRWRLSTPTLPLRSRRSRGCSWIGESRRSRSSSACSPARWPVLPRSRPRRATSRRQRLSSSELWRASSAITPAR